MVTTTDTAIIAKAAAVIEALTPTPVLLGNEPFTENKFPNPRLSRWALATLEGRVFRVFEVAPAPGVPRVDLGIRHPEATMCIVTLLVTVAYPARPSLFGYAEARELWAVMSDDALRIRNALTRVSALEGVAHLANFVEPRNPDLSRDHIWFTEMSVRAQFYVAQ